MCLNLITVNEGIPSESDEVKVSTLALPWVMRWMSENGFIHSSEASTARVHDMLAHIPPPYVPAFEEGE
jgi:hypothetical protein